MTAQPAKQKGSTIAMDVLLNLALIGLGLVFLFIYLYFQAYPPQMPEGATVTVNPALHALFQYSWIGLILVSGLPIVIGLLGLVRTVKRNSAKKEAEVDETAGENGAVG